MCGIRLKLFSAAKISGNFLGTKTLGECVSFMLKHIFMEFEKLNMLFVLFRNLEFVLLKTMLAFARHPLLREDKAKVSF